MLRPNSDDLLYNNINNNEELEKINLDNKKHNAKITDRKIIPFNDLEKIKKNYIQ